jgi:hypothetical protein
MGGVPEVPAVWRSTLLPLALLAALTGTPLRQAEAAADLARSLAELDQGHVIEPVDGGVGDESDATVLKAGHDAGPVLSTLPPATLDALAPTLPPPLDLAPAPDGRPPRPPSATARRLARLQRYRF